MLVTGTGDAGMYTYVPALQGKVLVVITGTIRNVSTGDAGLKLLCRAGTYIT